MQFSRFIMLGCAVALAGVAVTTMGETPPEASAPAAHKDTMPGVAQEKAAGADTVVIVGRDGVATIVERHQPTPEPFVVPIGTEVTQVVGEAGMILYGLERGEGQTRAADLRTVGSARVNGVLGDAGRSIGTADTIDVGAFRNAGSQVATVIFSTGIMMEVQPGEVVFVSDTMTTESLQSAMFAGGWICCCYCLCDCQGAPQIAIECNQVPQQNCAGMTGSNCEYGECVGEISSCLTRYVYDPNGIGCGTIE